MYVYVCICMYVYVYVYVCMYVIFVKHHNWMSPKKKWARYTGLCVGIFGVGSNWYISNYQWFLMLGWQYFDMSKFERTSRIHGRASWMAFIDCHEHVSQLIQPDILASLPRAKDGMGGESTQGFFCTEKFKLEVSSYTKRKPTGSLSQGACWLKSGPVSHLHWRDASVTILLAPEASASDQCVDMRGCFHLPTSSGMASCRGSRSGGGRWGRGPCSERDAWRAHGKIWCSIKS